MASLNSIGGIHYEMMRRCYYEKNVAYKDYGAKGIVVCEEWHERENFRNWAKENGYQKGMRLERIDGKGNYEPSNCRFGTKYKDRKVVKTILERAEKNKLKKIEVGIVGTKNKDPLYSTYNAMHTRCENPKKEGYENYGGRGIKVCKEWSGVDGFINFKKWANSNGWCKGLSIDRIDNDKGYEPNNCRFATPAEQSLNRRNNIKYNYCGSEMPLSVIAKIENVDYGKLRMRVKDKGMELREAIMDIKGAE